MLGAVWQDLAPHMSNLSRLGRRNVAGGETEAAIKVWILLLKLLIKLWID